MNKYIYFFLILNFFFGSLVNGDEMVNKKNYQTVDPFNKDLSKVISKRGMYSNGDYYPIQSMTLLATLQANNSKKSFKSTSILEMPDKSQIVVFEGNIIGKERAIVKTINQDSIILKLIDKNLEIKINK
jgi:Tfp pilus assembly protein PilP